MTVLSLQWRAALPRRAARPRRWTAIARRLGAVHYRPRPGRPYRDSFFADPALVEDDARRMSRPGDSARPV
jgi:hypothetical protein